MACPWRITELGQKSRVFSVRDAKGSRRKRAMPIAHEQISVVIDGRSIIEAYTKPRLLDDLVIRHPQFLPFKSNWLSTNGVLGRE